MKINHIKSEGPAEGLFILPFFESDNGIAFREISLSSKLFSGKKDTLYLLEKDKVFFLFVGWGKDPDYKTIKTAFRRTAAKQEAYFDLQATIAFPELLTDEKIEAAISGLILGSYKLGHFKKDKKKHPLAKEDFILNILSPRNINPIAERGIKIASAQLEAYYMVDLPPNKITPKHLSDWAINAGKKYGFSVEVLGQKKAQIAGLHAFLSVSKGSEREPQFIVMDYHPAEAKKHIGLAGKAVTFDTGGLNIKVAGMIHMKCDMAGGAAVLGAMQLIADLKLPFRVTAVVPACENVIDGKSFVPSDVIQSYSGSSIEVTDTDAEGRLILADALSYLIKNYKPQTVIDIATLTGSAVSTFGYECGALFTNNELLSKNIQKAGFDIGERLWPLPLWDAYKTDIESEIADVKNYSGKPVAGAISAAKFLEYFTENHPCWAHIDMAGVSFVDDEFAKTKHATAYGVHMLSNFIENQ
ncbi:MAG: leucyl aminopeptidase family protein [Flavobacteriaceae bacterium]|nr:leucyl aminopeptidase family protein [Flavobacteriaceae bacterium]